MRESIKLKTKHHLYTRWESINRKQNGDWKSFDEFVWWFEDMVFVEGLTKYEPSQLWICRLDKKSPYGKTNCKLRVRAEFVKEPDEHEVGIDDILIIRALAKNNKTWRYSCSQIGESVGLSRGLVYRIAIGESRAWFNSLITPVVPNWNLLNTQLKSKKFLASASI